MVLSDSSDPGIDDALMTEMLQVMMSSLQKTLGCSSAVRTHTLKLASALNTVVDQLCCSVFQSSGNALAELQSDLISFISEFHSIANSGYLPVSTARHIVELYIDAVGASPESITWFNQSVNELADANSDDVCEHQSIVNNDRDKLSPFVYYFIQSIHVDRIVFTRDVLEDLRVLLESIIRTKSIDLRYDSVLSITDHEMQVGEILGNLIAADVIHPSEGAVLYFIHGNGADFMSITEPLFDRYFQMEPDWKRDLMLRLALEIWINAPLMTIDYTSFAEMVSTHPYGEIQHMSLSLMSQLAMTDDDLGVMVKARSNRMRDLRDTLAFFCDE